MALVAAEKVNILGGLAALGAIERAPGIFEIPSWGLATLANKHPQDPTWFILQSAAPLEVLENAIDAFSKASVVNLKPT